MKIVYQMLIVQKLSMKTSRKIILILKPKIQVGKITQISSATMIKFIILIKEYNKLLKHHQENPHHLRKSYTTSWKLPKQVSNRLGGLKRKCLKLKGRWKKSKYHDQKYLSFNKWFRDANRSIILTSGSTS